MILASPLPNHLHGTDSADWQQGRQGPEQKMSRCRIILVNLDVHRETLFMNENVDPHSEALIQECLSVRVADGRNDYDFVVWIAR